MNCNRQKDVHVNALIEYNFKTQPRLPIHVQITIGPSTIYRAM